MALSQADATDALKSAYQLLLEFQVVIEGKDHPMAEALDRWLTLYEKGEQ